MREIVSRSEYLLSMEYLTSHQLSPPQVLSCGDNVLFCGLVHDEDVAHFPPELTDPNILSEIVNFEPASNALVTPETDAEGHLSLAPPVQEFRLTSIKLRPETEARVQRLETASTLFILRGQGSLRQEPGGDLHQLRPGQAYLVTAGQQLEVRAGSEGLEIYRTTVGQ